MSKRDRNRTNSVEIVIDVLFLRSKTDTIFVVVFALQSRMLVNIISTLFFKVYFAISHETWRVICTGMKCFLSVLFHMIDQLSYHDQDVVFGQHMEIGLWTRIRTSPCSSCSEHFLGGGPKFGAGETAFVFLTAKTKALENFDEGKICPTPRQHRICNNIVVTVLHERKFNNEKSSNFSGIFFDPIKKHPKFKKKSKKTDVIQIMDL